MSRTKSLQRYSPEARAALMAQHEASGLSVARFAREHGISPHTMAHWYRGRGRRRGPRAAEATFVPVTLATTPTMSAPETASPARAAYEVICAAGRVVRVRDDFDAATLRRLVAAFEADAC